MILPKPPACVGCVMHSITGAMGYVPPSGPPASSILLIGEAAGEDELYLAQPFVGAAGGLLNRVLSSMVRIERSSLHVANVLSCRPPNNHLEGASYEQSAIQTCRARHLQGAIDNWLATPSTGHKVAVTLGGVPLRAIMCLPKGHGIRVQDFHGTVSRDPSDQFWVVPTYHPSHLQRGAYNLMGVQAYDLLRAVDISRNGFVPEEVDLVCDPSVGWFDAWVDTYLAALADPREELWPWLAVDIETPDKAKQTDEGELKIKEARSYHIIRINFSYSTDQGITVPFQGPYLRGIKRVLEAPGVKVVWSDYDVKRLVYNNCPVNGPVYDGMWMAHVVQSDLPRGLGFWSPLICPRLPPWKHLSATFPEWYAANDGVRELRIALANAKTLMDEGRWEIPFYRHVHMLDKYAFHPSEAVGMLVDKPRLEQFSRDLKAKHDRLAADIQAVIPEEVLPVYPPKGWIDAPTPEQIDALNVTRAKHEDPPLLHTPFSQTVTRTVNVCRTCGEAEVSVKHKCTTGAPQVELDDVAVVRWFTKAQFNPASSQQVMAYIRFRGHKPGKDKKTKKDSSNKETIDRLAKQTKDPFYKNLRDSRAVDKVWKTYALGTEKRLAEDPRSQQDGRLHPTTTYAPSTGRTSQQNPNLQNVIADKVAGRENLTGGFRRCLVAEAGSYLMEADFSAIEAVETGWFTGDPTYIRLAKLSIHSYVATHVLGRPADLSLSDADLLAIFAEIKEKEPEVYDRTKRFVHGYNYGLSTRGMVLQFPEAFPTEAVARKIGEVYDHLAPKLAPWHADIREFAHKHKHLGGKIDHDSYNPSPAYHPYGYMHRFFNVLSYRPVKGVAPRGAIIAQVAGRNYQVVLGEDAKRCCAFFPQSTAAGVIKEAMLELFTPESTSYIGDVFHGRTPLRALVHDSLLLEVPSAKVDYVLERMVGAMTRPIEEQPLPPEWNMGSHLTLGVAVKVGQNWASFHEATNTEGMKKVKLPQIPETYTEPIVPVDEYDEDIEDLLDDDDAPTRKDSEVA